jgi:hypothetical protein
MRCIVGGFLVLSGVSPKEEEKIPLAIYRYNPGIFPTAGLIFERGFFNYTAGTHRPAVVVSTNNFFKVAQQ